MILKLMAETEGHNHILGTILRRLRSDWQWKYHIAPCPGVGFVERERFVCVFATGRPPCSAREGRRSEPGQFGMVRVTR
jgi:hypothetical protein